jgi:DNA-binding NtrC family response regulator
MEPDRGYRASRTVIFDDDGELRSLQDIEDQIIRLALMRYENDRSEVARRLRVGRATLYRSIERLSIPKRSRRGPVQGASGRERDWPSG